MVLASWASGCQGQSPIVIDSLVFLASLSAGSVVKVRLNLFRKKKEVNLCEEEY